VNDISQNLKDHIKTHNDNSADLQTQMYRNSIELQSLQIAVSETLSNIQEQLLQTKLSIHDLGQQIDGKLTIVEAGTRSIEASNQVTVAKLEKLTQALEFQSALISSMVSLYECIMYLC
jgi:methyltransferase-like protein